MNYSIVDESVSVSYISSFVSCFGFHVWVVSCGICLSLAASLGVIVSGSIHVAADGVILFFFMAK